MGSGRCCVAWICGTMTYLQHGEVQAASIMRKHEEFWRSKKALDTARLAGLLPTLQYPAIHHSVVQPQIGASNRHGLQERHGIIAKAGQSAAREMMRNTK